MLSTIIFLPLIGAVLALLVPRSQPGLARMVAMGAALATFVVSLVMLLGDYNQASGDLQFFAKYDWIPAWGIYYSVAIDGISVWLVMLTTFMTPLAIWSAWNTENRPGLFMALLLAQETGMLGVFLANDMFLFYIFWEFTLVPMYFMIGMWGGPRRIYATVKFFLYTFAGSIFMLLAIIAMGLEAAPLNSLSPGTPVFDIASLQNMASTGQLVFSPETMKLLFLAFFVAFAIKVPLWPLHTWLPDAHVEAPTAGSVILAAVLLKMGTYGLIRFNVQMFPEVARDWARPIAVLAVIGIIYGAVVAFSQRDIKKLVAYSSVSHMGFIVLGIFALNNAGLNGAILQMVNHGLSTGALFLMVGFIYERRHTRDIEAFGGLWGIMPVYTFLMLFVALSSMGLPGLNGFIGEFVIMAGAFQSGFLGWTFVAFAAIGVILAAVYLLRLFQGLASGTPRAREHGGAHDHALENADMTRRELGIILPLCAIILVIGLYPTLLFRAMDPAVTNVLRFIGTAVVGG
jgi:NADH-quinone oxidoreductase subunit M